MRAVHKHAGITNVRVLDPETETVSEPSTITFQGDRIASVSPGAPASTDRQEWFDAGGKIAVPGLIDCHVHVTANTADLGRLGEESPAYLTATAIRTMQDSLGRGFTTLRDAGGADFGLAAALNEKLVVGPHLYFAGKALSQTGGHADMRGPGAHQTETHPCCPSMGLVCDGVSEVRRAARNQLRTGADHVKIMLSGGVASPTDRVDSTQFSDEEIRAAVEEAEAANRYVLGHAYSARSINRGLRLGVRSIEHGNMLDEESVRLFLEKDAYVVPTLVTYERLKIEGAENGLPEASQRKVGDVLAAGLNGLKLSNDHGVNIAFGTDLLGGMRSWQSQEFEIRSRVQKPAEILRSATTNAARLLQSEDDLGAIKDGAFADIVLVNDNPLEDITVFSKPEDGISAVFTQGRLAEA